MEENEQKTSKYSSGININLRLDQLWKDTHNHCRENNFKLWNLDLDCIWAELARDLKQDKNKNGKTYAEINKDFNGFEEKIVQIGGINDSGAKGFKGVSQDDIKKRNEHYKILRDKQIFLARLENSLGKGTSFDDDDEDDM
jgi:hypothetical protein